MMTSKVASYDFDGVGGVGNADLNRFFLEPSAATSTRADYDGNGTINNVDLFYWFKAQSTDQQSSCAVVACIP